MQKSMVRSSGILLPIFSLPGKDAIGDLGKEARNFISLLSKSGQSVWQMLPIHPTSIGDSPFQGPSVFAGNPSLLSLEELVLQGDLNERHLKEYYKKVNESNININKVDYFFLWENKLGFEEGNSSILRKSYEGFLENQRVNSKRYEKFMEFCISNKSWLDDYSLFMAIKGKKGFGMSWIDWPKEQKNRTGDYIEHLTNKTGYYHYLQYAFHEQMESLKEFASLNHIQLWGDIPIYPAYDSVDVWANTRLFYLDDKLVMKGLSGVPPDLFSDEGQLWGNPLYKWGRLEEHGSQEKVFEWWGSRLEHELKYFDKVKLDHFRGFDSFGVSPPEDKTAFNCVWYEGPQKRFFDYLSKNIDLKNRLIAEDLGVITPRIIELLEYSKIPGMRVLQFGDYAKMDPNDKHIPSNRLSDVNSVFYIGTHDNETLKQYLQTMKEKNFESYSNLVKYLKHCSKEEGLNWKAIDSIQNSESSYSILSMQDILFLGKEARLNFPSTGSGNWQWRMNKRDYHKLSHGIFERLDLITKRNMRTI